MPNEHSNYRLLLKYEQDVRKDRSVSAKEFIDRQTHKLNNELITELIALDMEVRLQIGDPIDLDFYRHEYPVFRDSIADLFSECVESLIRTFCPVTSLIGALPCESGDYLIEEEIGRGGMGVVYRAVRKSTGDAVAVKVQFFSREDISSEAESLSLLQHPNICRFYDVGELKGLPFMSMQLIHGKALSEIIAAEGPLDPQRATGVIIAIASAMESAHQCNVIHHDLKPANILMDGNTGQPVITDFGVSTSEYQQQGANGREPGTPSYMAPECFDDNANENGPAGDIFSAGAVLYEMLTARKAFGGPVEYVIEQLLNDPPRRPADYDSRIPLELESICLKALSRDPATRFESMRALETALRSLNFDPFVTGPALA